MKHFSYLELERRHRRINLLGESLAVLHWDTATVMPAGGAATRAEQLAEMQAVLHGLKTEADMGDIIENAEAEGQELNDWQRANLREIAREWRKAKAVPEDLVVAVSRACSACESIWREARANDDFLAVKSSLQEVLDRTREAGQAKADALGLTVYDALLDDYEPGGRSAEIDRIFGELQQFLPEFLGEALDLQASRPVPNMPDGPFAIEDQKKLGERLMSAFGFDFEHGRLDISLHPFCGGTPEDVRITTRYDEYDFTSSLMGVLHETGHAMYERALPKAWRCQPVGSALGMSFHESQSLLIEMQVCRSLPFIGWAAPIMREMMEGSGPAWEVENLYRLFTRVKPDFIRVDADEVTYPAHVILRYQLERALLDENLLLSELPAAWNDGMKDLLGVAPKTDREGCLQDVHWYDGAWGYFPTYTLGAMTAAQLFKAACESDKDIPAGIRKGDFRPLMGWLGENVHSKGRLVSSPDLLKAATGQPLETEVFMNHLRCRYLA